MYRAIHSYGGDFGDGVETGPYDPLVMLWDDELAPDAQRGICVASLCYLATAIDNSNYDSARNGMESRAVKLAYDDGRFDDIPIISGAVEAFFVSEVAFSAALRAVYLELIEPTFAEQSR